MAVLRNDSKCSHTACMLRFFTVSRLALNPNLIYEIGSCHKKGCARLPVVPVRPSFNTGQPETVNRHF